MQRSRSIRPKSSRLLDREIADALAKPRRSVPGYLNYGGGGPFAPMGAPPPNSRGKSKQPARAHAARASRAGSGAQLPWEGSYIPIDPSPRTIKSFELSRPYVVRHRGRLYTVVLDTRRGNVAHPAKVEGRASSNKPTKRVRHATKAKASSKAATDKINIDQLAKLLNLPDWDKVDEMNQQHYWEMARGAEDQEEAEQEAQTEVYNRWYDAVESAASKLFDEHGLELDPTGKEGTQTRRYNFKIVPFNSWDDAADKIRETINGVGDLHFGSLREFLDSGPYTARQAVLAHLGYIKRYPLVYGGLGANQLYEQAWR